jgi:hypothetical protein
MAARYRGLARRQADTDPKSCARRESSGGASAWLAIAIKAERAGVTEFAEPIGIPSPNVSWEVNPKHVPTQETLERLLRPFRPRIALPELKPKRRRFAA